MKTNKQISPSDPITVIEDFTITKNTFSDVGSEIEEVISKRPPFVVRWGTVFFFFLLLVIVLTSWYINYPEIVIAKAKLVSVDVPQQVITRTDGKLIKITVSENERVEKGQILGYMESLTSLESVISIGKQIDSIDFLLRGNRTNEIIRFFKRNNSQRFADNLGELQKPFQTFIESLIQFSKINSKQISLSQTNSYLLSINNLKKNKKKEVSDFENETILEKNACIQALQTIKSEIQAWQSEYVLRAPVAGVVSFTDFWHENQQVNSKQILFFVRPVSTLHFAEILVPTYGLGKVKQGQKVLLKIQAYPFQQYGSVVGEIKYLNYTLTDSGYLAKVVLPEGLTTNYKKSLQYRDGLLAEADIITGNMRLLYRFYYSIVK